MIVKLQDLSMRTMRGRNALLSIFELWVGLAGVISGIVFFYSPASIDKNALAIVVGHSLAASWSVAYFTAGVLIWLGLLQPNPRAEIVGLFILGSATAFQGIAIIAIFELRGSATALTLLSLTFAAWLRATFVLATAVRLAREEDAA